MYPWLARRCYVYQARLGLTVVYLALTCELALKAHHHTQSSPNGIFKKFFLILFVCVCVFVCAMDVWVPTEAHGSFQIP